MTTKKKSKKYPKMRFRKKDPVHNLLAATQHWVQENGGEIIVIGGIKLMEMPYAPAGKYSVVVDCLGRKPVKAKEAA